MTNQINSRIIGFNGVLTWLVELPLEDGSIMSSIWSSNIQPEVPQALKDLKDAPESWCLVKSATKTTRGSDLVCKLIH